jgi:hypothetical protein
VRDDAGCRGGGDERFAHLHQAILALIVTKRARTQGAVPVGNADTSSIIQDTRVDRENVADSQESDQATTDLLRESGAAVGELEEFAKSLQMEVGSDV